jgi:hypothetical protein
MLGSKPCQLHCMLASHQCGWTLTAIKKAVVHSATANAWVSSMLSYHQCCFLTPASKLEHSQEFLTMLQMLLEGQRSFPVFEAVST